MNPLQVVPVGRFDAQWAILAPLIPSPPRRTDGRGRPSRDAREVLGGVLWVVKTGARWRDLPDRYPPHQTCHRRFQQWVRSGVLERVLRAVASTLLEQGRIDLSEAFIDGTFVPVKRGGAAVGPTKRGKGTKIMAVADRSGLPVALHIDSASFAWLFCWRRLVVRYEHYPENFLGLVQLACTLILLRRLG